jgi:hypothetical protein
MTAGGRTIVRDGRIQWDQIPYALLVQGAECTVQSAVLCTCIVAANRESTG